MRRERGNGGDECADAGGDAHADIEEVVEHQRRGGQQAAAAAQVFAGHGVRAAAVGVGGDGLAVAEEDDASSRMMVRLMGRTYAMPAAASGIRMVSAASGP